MRLCREEEVLHATITPLLQRVFVRSCIILLLTGAREHEGTSNLKQKKGQCKKIDRM